MKSIYTLLLVMLALSGIATTRSLNKRCKEGGPIYTEHPTDCEKFVQCHRDASGILIGEILNCPFSTYWSKEILNCLPAEQIMCNSDKCSDLPDGTVRTGGDNCRGFWECNGGKSEARCCPLRQRFNDTINRCVETENGEEKCTDTCLGVEYDWGNETSNETVPCNKMAVSGEPEYYMEEAVGMVFKRPCSPGTFFDQDKCDCAIAEKPAQKAACKQKFYLPFVTDHSDMSGIPHFVGNKNVMVFNGSANFNGDNSRLNLPFFNNMEHVNAIVIRINYTSTSDKGRYPQVIVSNSGCGFLPSIVISENKQDVEFIIGTTESLVSSVVIPKPEVTTENVLEFRFSNETLRGSVNGVSAAVAANGFLRNVQCDLSIGGLPEYANGRLKEMANFDGKINELSVYLCDPENHQ